MEKVTYGVIGVGSLGRHHARWAGQISAINFQGIFDTDAERLKEIGQELDCPTFDSLDALLEKCDAVSIAVTTSHHLEVAEKVIAAGKHLLIEKPIAVDLDEADKIINAAEKAGVKLMVGQIERFNPALKCLKEYNLAPRFIEAHRLAAFNPRGADVAVVLDLMIHDIDLVLNLVKSPVRSISASAVRVISDSEDIANARLTFENGTVANLTASRISLQPMRKIRIFQESGYFSIDLAARQADMYRILSEPAGEGEISIPLGSSGKQIGYRKIGNADEDMLQAELTSFAESIITDQPVAVSGREGREALAVALQVISESQKAAFESNGK